MRQFRNTPADHGALPEDDARREAYERGIDALRGRAGVLESLTVEQVERLIRYDGPETIGRPSKAR